MMVLFNPRCWRAVVVSKPIVFLMILCTLSGCAHVDYSDYKAPHELARFESEDGLNQLVHDRKAALEAIEKLPSKDEFWEKYKFWKKWCEPACLEEVIVYGMKASESPVEEVLAEDEFITNNQERQVDEGGIVKRLGDYMIVLRKGKLYSLHIGNEVRKVDEVDVQPDSWKHDAWYDEILAANGKVVVVGYSYDTDGSEYLFFDVNNQGMFTRGSIQHIHSNDYYSETNYASRLVDGNLVFLIEDIPLFDHKIDQSPVDMLNVRSSRIAYDGTSIGSYPLFASHDIYQPILGSDYISATTIAVCPIDKEEFRCDATTILGGGISESYVSSNAYYLWMSGEWNIRFEAMSDREKKGVAWREFEGIGNTSLIYKIPFSDGPAGAVEVEGWPIDQFSFKEAEGALKLLSRHIEGEGSWYFDPRFGGGQSYYVHIPADMFSESVPQLNRSQYSLIRESVEDGWMRNRFVGDKLVLVDHFWNDDSNENRAEVIVFDTDARAVINEMVVKQEFFQIHPVGEHALLVGTDDNDVMRFSSLALDSAEGIVSSIDLADYGEAETRSHAFFYKPDANGGLFAIPLDVDVTDGKTFKRVDGVAYHLEESTDMVYTRLYPDLQMERAGLLEGSKQPVWYSDDGCDVSCYDWYGSSRPIFWGDRIFSLIKYELVEGRLDKHGRIKEVGRINFQ